MSTLEQVCRKLATRLPANHVAPQASSLATLWPAGFFRLPDTAFWQQATAAQRDQLLYHCASALLREALGIERTAMDYCAHRVLATEDALEKQVYSLTGADEARAKYHKGNARHPLERFQPRRRRCRREWFGFDTFFTRRQQHPENTDTHHDGHR